MLRLKYKHFNLFIQFRYCVNVKRMVYEGSHLLSFLAKSIGIPLDQVILFNWFLLLTIYNN
jgi:hypothetical protein